MKRIKRRQPQGPISAWPQERSSLLERIFAARNVTNISDIDFGLKSLFSFELMKDIKNAAERIKRAIVNDERILIVGDFDCDGATSTALAVHALRAFGSEDIEFLVPNRFEYGYGLTTEIVDVAKTFDPELIITVDNGIASLDGVKKANELGYDVIVTDHHLPGDTLPEAQVIVNPNQPDATFPSKNLAGVGVIFYVMLAVRATLQAANWFELRGISCPNMADYLDLVALGTVADVVKLDRNNRVLVQQGILRMRAGRVRPGIQALIEVAKRNMSRVTPNDLGYGLGPRLNAAGRIDDMSLGIRCLLAETLLDARVIANELDELNDERREIESKMQEEAMKVLQALELGQDLPKVLCLYDPGWHQGVVGLLASRLKERYHRPVVVFAKTDNGELKGSARSISAVHIRDLFDTIATQHPNVLSRFGGHAMAAGLTIQEENFSQFKLYLEAEVEKLIDNDALQATVETDGELVTEYFTVAVAELLRDAAPWGQGFPEPAFDGEFIVTKRYWVGGNHLKMLLQVPKTDTFVDAIKFHADKSWADEQINRIKAVFKLDVNRYRGRDKLQLLIDEMAEVEPEKVLA